jgi:hypothetical protein
MLKLVNKGRILAILLAVALFLPLSVTAQKGGRGGRTSSSKSSSSKSSSGKTVHVKGYTRKDGTYVPPYDRAAPGSGSSSTASSRSTGSSIDSSDSVNVGRDSHGRIKRGAAAKHDFMLLNPCPITGSTTKCPGYVVDHIKPLACGGADAPSNMQWQTKEAAKAKDKWERAGCR